MNKYRYDCDYCHHSFQTGGPYPYNYENGKKKLIESYSEQNYLPIIGLIADVYCLKCDKEKRYIIAKYKEPILNLLSIWIDQSNKIVKTTCQKCKDPLYLTIPNGIFSCPRCRKGSFHNIEKLYSHQEHVYNPVSAPKSQLKIKQDSKSIKIPKPIAVIDSAERMGYKFDRFTNWFSGTITKRLAYGDYTIEGLENELAVERKTLPDLIGSIITKRLDFIQKMERMCKLKKACVVIESTLSKLKTPYIDSHSHPNAVLGSIIAAQERWNIPFYFLDNKILAEEFVASMLSKYHALWYLKKNNYKRCFIEHDI